MGTISLIYGVLFLLIASTQSLPVTIKNLEVTDHLQSSGEEVFTESVNNVIIQSEELIDVSNRSTLRNTIRPGMLVTNYVIEIEPDRLSGTFSAVAMIQVSITDLNTREDPVIFHAKDLNIRSVQFSLIGGSILYNADFDMDDDDGLLEIETGLEATLYTFVISYSGSLEIGGRALWTGYYDDK